MTTELQTERHDTTLVLRLHGPATRNALSPQVYAAGVETLNMAETHPDVRAVVLTGANGHFCGGGDLQRLAHQRMHDMAAQARNLDAFHQWIEALHSFPKPVIAAVEGVAAGGGVSLALACDLLVAAQDSVFVMAYSNVGLSPDGGATWSLARALPRATALQLLMGGERITPERLQQLGVINTVCGNGEALDQALTLAERLNARAPNALASIKDLVNDAASVSLHTQLAAERDHFVRNLHHANAGEGIAAFLDKRPARYR